ncbi:hypothetical protein OSTOST_12829, partial [Ostertagia ostertagi]
MKLETIGICDNPSDQQENERVIKTFYDTVQIRDNKIFVQFPWKANKHLLADNYGTALGRLHQLYRTWNDKPSKWLQYCGIIEDHIKRGIVEDVQAFEKDLSKQSSYKILGQSWNPTSDEFVLQSKLIYARHPTKRRILQQTPHPTPLQLVYISDHALPRDGFYSNLIIARHRLTPAKQLNSNPEITIPKLELVAL